MANYYDQMEEKSRSATEETPRQAIRRVREKTCYGALRAIIVVAILPGHLSAAVVLVAGIAGVVEWKAAGLAGAPVAVLLAAAILIATLAAHQALRLLVDIADLLIEQVRAK